MEDEALLQRLEEMPGTRHPSSGWLLSSDRPVAASPSLEKQLAGLAGFGQSPSFWSRTSSFLYVKKSELPGPDGPVEKPRLDSSHARPSN